MRTCEDRRIEDGGRLSADMETVPRVGLAVGDVMIGRILVCVDSIQLQRGHDCALIIAYARYLRAGLRLEHVRESDERQDGDDRDDDQQFDERESLTCRTAMLHVVPPE